jgi:ubiquinone biosynthesis protein
MAEQVGWRGMVERLKAEAPRFAHIFPQLPRLVHQVLEHHARPNLDKDGVLALLVLERRRTNRLLGVVAGLAGAVVVGLVLAHLYGSGQGFI